MDVTLGKSSSLCAWITYKTWRCFLWYHSSYHLVNRAFVSTGQRFVSSNQWLRWLYEIIVSLDGAEVQQVDCKQKHVKNYSYALLVHAWLYGDIPEKWLFLPNHAASRTNKSASVMKFGWAQNSSWDWRLPPPFFFDLNESCKDDIANSAFANENCPYHIENSYISKQLNYCSGEHMIICTNGQFYCSSESLRNAFFEQ